MKNLARLFRCFSLLVTLIAAASAQTLPFFTDQQYKYLVGEISGDAAYEHLRFTTQFHKPDGGTPIGGAVADATNALWKIHADSRHVLVITDGENTVGRAPDVVLPKLQNQCLKNGLVVHFHFLAFDVDAKVFGGIKKFGATLVGASDEAQLNQKLNFLLEEKILLEKE